MRAAFSLHRRAWTASRLGAAAGLVLGMAAPLGQAQLADPTRPATAAPARPAAASDATAARHTQPAAAVAPRLQSVQVRANGANSALVDGRLVQVGSRVGAWTVHAIDLDGVELRSDRARQRLALATGAAIKQTPSNRPVADASDSEETRRRATAPSDRKDPS